MENYLKINTICLFILTAIAVAFVLATTKVILIPFTLAIFISLVYSPFIRLVQKRLKIHRALAMAISTIGFIIIITLVALFVTKSVDSFVAESEQYKDKFQQAITKSASSAQSLGINVEESNLKSLAQKFPVGKLIKGVSTSLLNLLSNTFLVIIFTLFLITGESMSTKKNLIFEEIKKSAGKYIQTKILTSGATAILTYAVLAVFDVEMAFMFAILTFSLNFIPSIGSIIAVILPLPIIVLQFGFGLHFAAILALLAVIQVVIGNILEPKLMGESMGLHPVTILLFLTFWGYLWGVTGMFLSVPITATLKIVFEKFELTKPVAQLFSGKLELS